jgi:hypothetical protein
LETSLSVILGDWEIKKTDKVMKLDTAEATVIK